MKVACDSCKTECDIAVNGPTLLRRALPRGWRPRRIDGRVYVLCDICGNLRQFVGGLSPYLATRLGLPPNVSIEFPEYTELPDAWLMRQRKALPRVSDRKSEDRPMTDINKIITASAPGSDPEQAARAAELDGWSEPWAKATAQAEGLALEAPHLEIIAFLRATYIESGPAGRARDLAALLDRQFAARGGRRYLYEMFPGGPVAQGGRLAGIPVPADAKDLSFGSML